MHAKRERLVQRTRKEMTSAHLILLTIVFELCLVLRSDKLVAYSVDATVRGGCNGKKMVRDG